MIHYEGSDFINNSNGTDKGWQDYKVKQKPTVQILTAEETRQRQKELTEDSIEKELESIFMKINAKIDTNFVVLYSRPRDKVKDKLVELGYKLLEVHDQRDLYSITISW